MDPHHIQLHDFHIGKLHCSGNDASEVPLQKNIHDNRPRWLCGQAGDHEWGRPANHGLGRRVATGCGRVPDGGPAEPHVDFVNINSS